MADSNKTPGLPGGNKLPKLPGSGGKGKNPFEKKELDILDPEAKAQEKGKKSLGDVAKGIKKSVDKVKKLINFLKHIPPQVLLVIAIVALIIFIVVGVIGFILFIPGLAINALKQFAQGAIDTVQSWFTTEADAYINEEDIVDLANYLEEMEYDLVGYGFITPNPNFSSDAGVLTTSELAEQGYIYFERRGDVQSSRYYSQSAEEDPEGTSVYNGLYYNSLGIMIDNNTGEMVDAEKYIDQYGLVRSTEEVSSNGAGKIVGFGNDFLSGVAGWSVDTKLLRTYLLSDYKIYAVRNADGTFLNDLYKRIKKTFGGYDSAWSKGLVKFYYANDGIAESAWSADWDSLVYGDEIKINGTKMTIRNGYFNNPIIFNIEGWADRYGMNLEFLLSLHIATMQPDLVYAMLQSFDTEVQVYLNDSGESKVESAYLDMLNPNVELGNEGDMITFSDAKAILDEQGGIDLNDWLVNDMYLTSGLSGLAISKADAQYLLDNLPLESPPNCSGAAEVDIILESTYKDTAWYSWDDYLTKYDINRTDIGNEAANISSASRDVETDEGEFVDFKAANCTYKLAGEGTDIGTDMSATIDTGFGYSDTVENVIDDDNFMFFKNVGESLGYNDVSATTETDTEDTDDMYCNNFGDFSVFDIDGTKTTRTWTATAKDKDGNEIIGDDGLTESVEYEWVTYKFVIYRVGNDYDLITADGYTELDEPKFVAVIVWEYIIRDKTFEELVACGAINENGEETPRSQVCSAVNHDADDSNDQEKCCKNCQTYVKKVIVALGQVSDGSYSSYTPYIARVLGSWFRDTYFAIPEEPDEAIKSYKNESGRTPSDEELIDNSWGESELVIVDEEYLAETEEYWTSYEMNGDDYQLYYLYPNGITSDYKMEEFIANPYEALESYQTGYAARYDITSDMKYGSQLEAENAGHAFVKKAVTSTVSQLLSYEEGNNILWSAYGFDSNGAATGWLRISYDDDNEEVNDVYDITSLASDTDYYNEEGGFYYNITSTNRVTQVEDAQRSQTNPTVKWLFKYRKYYTYDGSEETAMRIAKDKEIVLDWANNYLIREYGAYAGTVAEKLGEYGRSALRQTYGGTITFDWEDVTEQWLDWQLDMYYSGIIECPESDYKLGDLVFIATLDENGETVSITETSDENTELEENQELRIGDPRDPDLIGTTNVTKTSLEAFTILENTKTLASEYAYRDFKELIVELDYFDKEELSDAISSVFTWVLPEISPIGWPKRPWDKQDTEYGALIESKGTYEYLEDSEIDNRIDTIYDSSQDNEPILGNEIDETVETTNSTTSTDLTDSQVSLNATNTSEVNDEIEIAATSDTSSSSLSKTVGSSSIPSTAQARLQDTYTTAGTADAILNNINRYGGDSDQQSTMSIDEIKSLGGIFEKYADYNNSGKNNINYTVTTVEEFQEVNEYVFALMTIFGFDYGNGNVNHRFGNLGVGADQGDAIFGTSFSYYDSAGLSYSYKPIEEILSDANNPRRGNCNVTADIVFYAAGLLPMTWVTCSENRIVEAGGVAVTNVDDIQVSDLIMCYDDSGNWYHVKWVGEIDENGNITVYDGGSYYNNHGGDFKIENQNEDLAEGLANGNYKIWHLFDLSGSAEFEGYEGGEYVSSPVTGKVLEYGTHKRTNVYTGNVEEVGYVVIEAIDAKYFTDSIVSNNSGDTENMETEDIVDGLNLFYEEYEDTCAGFIITIDGFKVDLNTVDEEENNGSYEQNEVAALYNSEEQSKRERNEQLKDDAPFFINYGESADLGSLPEEYYCDLENSENGYYIKEGKYLGITLTDEEAENLVVTASSLNTTTGTGEHEGPANYIRIIAKDKDYSIIDNVEDYFYIPDPEEGSSTTGIYADLEAITEDSPVEEKVRAMISYYVSQGFTPEGAAGIVGNAAIENSGLVCTSGLDGSGTYVGLFQLERSSRWQVMRSWMIENGYNEDSFAGQVRAAYESEDANHLTSMGGSWEELKSLTNTRQAAELFAVYYEGCVGSLGNAGPTEWYSIGPSYPVGTYYQGLLDRKQAAENALKIYQGEAVDLYEGTSY